MYSFYSLKFIMTARNGIVLINFTVYQKSFFIRITFIFILVTATTRTAGAWTQTQWKILLYSTDSYFHILIFVFVLHYYKYERNTAGKSDRTLWQILLPPNCTNMWEEIFSSKDHNIFIHLASTSHEKHGHMIQKTVI